jgi:hypothetical protein
LPDASRRILGEITSWQRHRLFLDQVGHQSPELSGILDLVLRLAENDAKYPPFFLPNS